MPLILTCTCIYSLFSLQESSTVLEKWLTTQEKKLQEIKKDETKLENLYKTLLMQRYCCLWALPKEDCSVLLWETVVCSFVVFFREPFDSLAQLANSLRETGLTEDEIISETSDLVSRYQTLMTNVNEMAGNTQGLSVDEHFKELAQDISSWIKKLEKAINNLSSQESELPPEERINQIKVSCYSHCTTQLALIMKQMLDESMHYKICYHCWLLVFCDLFGVCVCGSVFFLFCSFSVLFLHSSLVMLEEIFCYTSRWSKTEFIA